MKSERQNILRVSKRGASRLLVFLFVLYALADISVLQIYCGNEAIGIPPAHHLTRVKEANDNYTDKMIRMQGADDHKSPVDDQSDSDCNDECFGGCAHIILGRFFFEPTELIDSQIVSSSRTYENKYSNSNLTHLFRPPQSA
jgi:hypothetical protein